jgi:hypothetical protein
MATIGDRKTIHEKNSLSLKEQILPVRDRENSLENSKENSRHHEGAK